MEFTAASFEGDNFDEWLEFAKLGSFKDQFTGVGIESFDDLKEACEAEEVLLALKSGLAALQWSKFRKAVQNSPGLNRTILMMFTTVTRESVSAGGSGSRHIDSSSSRRSSSTATSMSLSTSGPATASSKTSSPKSLTMGEISSMIERKKLSIARASDPTKKRELEEELKKYSELSAVMRTHTETTLHAKEETYRLSRKLLRTKERSKVLAGLEDKLRNASSLEICFLLDCTGSMAGHINAMKSHINLIPQSIEEFYPDVPLRVAFIGYRDHCDGDNRLAVFRFSSDIAAFRTFVGSQNATGGGDGPEDVFGALSVAGTLDWQSAIRLIYHIGDAPCHGTKYHSMSDDHPSGDPHGLQAEDLIPALVGKEIQYHFGKITPDTDRMIAAFNEIASTQSQADRYVTTFDAKDTSKLMSSIASSVTASMYSSISSSKLVGKDVEEVPVIVDTSEPIWPSIATETVSLYRLSVRETSIDDLLREETSHLDPIPSTVALKVARLPFSHGSIRAVYKVKSSRSSDPAVVHKVPRTSRTVDKVREKFESSYIDPHWAASVLAVNFESVRPSAFPSIRYTEVSLVQYLERPGAPYCTREGFMAGAFEKYNNNSGMVLPNPSPSGHADHDVIQAFSHWTFSVTKGTMIVVDCQGTYDRASNSFLLTDPALHCTDVTRFGNTNLHRVGFKRFFLSHRCNDCCRALGLSVPTL